MTVHRITATMRTGIAMRGESKTRATGARPKRSPKRTHAAETPKATKSPFVPCVHVMHQPYALLQLPVLPCVGSIIRKFGVHLRNNRPVVDGICDCHESSHLVEGFVSPSLCPQDMKQSQGIQF